MPTLPTVLVTDTIRASQKGESHGGAYLVDLERGSSRQVIDWNDQSIAWDGRGAERGLRGAAIHNGEVIIASAAKIHFFDPEFKLKRSVTNAYLGDAHDLFVDGDLLYITSTRFDSILALDLRTYEFVNAWMFRLTWERDPRTSPDPGPARPKTLVYNPMRPNGPHATDTTHINAVWVEDKRIYFAGVMLPYLMYIEHTGQIRKHADLPMWTHNARPFRGGVLCNLTKSDNVCVLDLAGTIVKQFPVPKYDEAALTNIPEKKAAARQAFARGLFTTPEGLLVTASSPSTVTAYDIETGGTLKSVNITMDVRHAPHGLVPWPFR